VQFPQRLIFANVLKGPALPSWVFARHGSYWGDELLSMRSSFLAWTGPMPRIMPEASYFSTPSVVFGADVRKKRTLNCWPSMRSFTHSPDAVIHSAGGDCCGVSDHRHEIAVATRLRPLALATLTTFPNFHCGSGLIAMCFWQQSLYERNIYDRRTRNLATIVACADQRER
jgi:hypothetical protein